MRSRISKAVMLALSLVLVFTMTASAGSTTKSLSTNFTLVNMDSATANVTVSYFKDDGSVWDADAGNESFTIDGFGQKIIAQYFDETMTGGKGSAVVSSDTSLGAVVQILARNQTPTSGAYSGVSAGSNSFYVPLVLRQRPTANGLTNTQIMIQNLDSAGAISVDVTFTASPGSSFTGFTKTIASIPANSTYYYDVADEAATNLPDGWFGSAVVTAETGKLIAVVVNVFAGDNSLQTFNGFPVEIAGTSWSVPQFTSKLGNGLNTPVTVQNVSGGEIAIDDIQLDCFPATGYTGEIHLTNPVAVADTASYAFNPVNNADYPNAWSGACFVTASGNVVTYVQMRKPGVNEEFAAYEAFRADGTDTKVVVPLASKHQANGFASVITIQNLDTTNQALVRLTYTRAANCTVGDPSYILDETIEPGANLYQNLRLEAGGPATMPNGWFGSLTVEVQPGETARPIVGYVQLTNYLPTAGDTLMAHDAFSLP